VDPETITVAWPKTLALAESFRLSVYNAAYRLRDPSGLGRGSGRIASPA
jgi:hypothetical protein